MKSAVCIRAAPCGTAHRYEGNAFAATGDAAADLLSITAVHRLREDAVAALLARSGATWDSVQELTACKR